MKPLSELPNIGKELENRLSKVGINSSGELKNMGSCRAFQLLHAVDPSTCINTLMALEGAIQNIRWHNLEQAKKQELKEFLNMLNR
jgi:DNA transformation protein and related proteins